MSQVELVFDPPVDAITRHFEEFHEKNPHVYATLRRMSLSLRRAGRRHYGIAGLFEVLRYESSLMTSADDGLKLNNNYRALYSRLLEDSEPELEGFFSMRERRARFIDGQVVHPGDLPSPPDMRYA